MNKSLIVSEVASRPNSDLPASAPGGQQGAYMRLMSLACAILALNGCTLFRNMEIDGDEEAAVRIPPRVEGRLEPASFRQTPAPAIRAVRATGAPQGLLACAPGAPLDAPCRRPADKHDAKREGVEDLYEIIGSD